MMRTRRVTAVVAAVVATVAVVGVDGAVAAPGDGSYVDEVTAVVGSGGIAVTGQATFVDVPVVVGEDPAGDADGAVVPLGHDLTTVTISRPDPFADMVRVAVDLENQPPLVVGTVPEILRYRWAFTVTTGGKTTEVMLMAYRSSTSTNALQGFPHKSADPFFEVHVCPGGGNCQHFYGTSGSMENGIVAWDLPLGMDSTQGQIGGHTGSMITGEVGHPGTPRDFPVVAEAAAPGILILSVLDRMAVDTAYAVPGPGVRIGIAPAGTPPENVPLTVPGTVTSLGAFTGHLPTPDTPGEYTIVAQACHGTNSCGIATTNITV